MCEPACIKHNISECLKCEAEATISGRKFWGCIYSAINLLNGKEYIGYDSTGDPENHRWKHHKKMAATAQPRFYFHRAIKAAGGPEKFKWTIIWRGPIERLNEKEVFYIKKRHTFVHDPLGGGYNMTKGGGGNLGFKLSKKTKQRISASNKRNYEENPVRREELRRMNLERTANPVVRKEMSRTRSAFWAKKTLKERKRIGAASALGRSRRTPEERVATSKLISDAAQQEWTVAGFRESWRIANAAGWAQRTEEECKAYSEVRRAVSVKMWARRTPEERAAVNAAALAGNAKRTPAEKAATNELRRLSALKRYAETTPEERSATWHATHPNGNRSKKKK